MCQIPGLFTLTGGDSRISQRIGSGPLFQAHRKTTPATCGFSVVAESLTQHRDQRAYRKHQSKDSVGCTPIPVLHFTLSGLTDRYLLEA